MLSEMLDQHQNGTQIKAEIGIKMKFHLEFGKMKDFPFFCWCREGDESLLKPNGVDSHELE